MKKLIFIFACALCISASAENTDSLKKDIANLKQSNAVLVQKISKLESSLSSTQSSVNSAKSDISANRLALDSVRSKTEVNSSNIKQTAEELGIELKNQNEVISTNFSDINKSVSNKANFFVIAIAIILIILIVYIYLARKKSNTTDHSIQLLKDAQKSLETQSIKLDNQLIEILEKKMKTITESTPSNVEPDHSLPLKVADEIVRIQNNIDRMDSTDKNVARLNKALDRMKSSFTAYGYEIVDMRGQEYTDNMPFEARFIPDEQIEEGKRIISGMDRLMVRYNGKMIQAPILAVRQNV